MPSPSLFDLSGRVALVTGGNGGIGFGIAQGLADAGATVVIAGRNRQKALQALEQLGPTASFEPFDMAEEASCRDLIDRTAQNHGRLDILVNSAGINIRKQPQDFTAEEWQQVIGTNLTGVFFCCQTAHAQMCRCGGGKIINIGSMNSLFGSPYGAPYAASKGAIVQLTKSLALSWAKDNIQVNAILPGWIDTELTVAAREQVPGLHDRIVARTPVGRWGQPSDMAGAGVFLASRASDFVTGVAIPVDGGYAAQG